MEMKESSRLSADKREGVRVPLQEADLESSRKSKEGHTRDEPVQPNFKPWRVFINHIDSYHGRKLADILLDRVYINPEGELEGMGEGEEFEGVEEEEEEEEEEEGEEMDKEDTGKDEKFSNLVDSPKKYEVIGTTSIPDSPAPEDVTMIIKDAKDRETLLHQLMRCGIVIYDITQDDSQVEEARWALKSIVQMLEQFEQASPKAFKRSKDVRYFVLISTLMTWTNTKPLSPDEPDLPFTEEDYRKRKPHPNFKEHIQCEKDVVIIKKKTKIRDKLKTLVVCCGITYGDEQGPLHHLFKMAWQNAPLLPIFGKGRNRIPLLHVRDLTSAMIDVLQNWPPVQYIVAAEQEPTTQATIAKQISRALTTGKVSHIAQEEAFLLPEVTQRIFDLMTMNLIVDPVYITDRISWHLDAPFRDNINVIVKEYKAARDLHPVRIIVLGPPVSGKTKVARYLAKHYCIHYIHVKSLISETVEKLTAAIEEATATPEQGEEEEGDEDEEGEDEEEGDEATNVAEMQELLDEIDRNMRRTDGRLDDSLVNKLFLRKLRSAECSNQGYVIDGYPKTLEQAKELFAGENANEIDEELDEEVQADGTVSIMPELVVSLEASDEFLKERIIHRPEKEIQGTHYTEEHMVRRLKEFRARNTDDNTPLQFFDEIEIHPLIIDIEDDVCPDMFPTIHQCLQKIGPPKNYGLTVEEAGELKKRAEEEKRAAEAAAKLQEDNEFQERKRIREEKMAEWTDLMEKLKEEEEERLCLLGLPLRHYLVKYVFPTLTKGLIEVANLRPDDPVDYLAEFLFRENPEGKMFEPEYTEALDTVLTLIEKYSDTVLHKQEISNTITQFLHRKTDVSMSMTERSEFDVCTSPKLTTCVTSCFGDDDTDAYEKEEETVSGSTANYDQEN